jgi:hypothetical protein
VTRARRHGAALALCAALAAAAFAQEGGLRELAPTWAPGLEWTVVTHPIVFAMPKTGQGEILKRDPSTKVLVRFAVKRLAKVEGVSCYEVVATSDHRPDDEVVLLVRAEDLSVKELRRRNKPTGTQTVVANGRTPFVLLETSALCPWDLPLFPAESKDEERTFDLGDGRKVVQKVKLERERGEVRVELATTWNGKKLVTAQVWKIGAPFWSKCTRTVDGVEEESAELDETSLKK